MNEQLPEDPSPGVRLMDEYELRWREGSHLFVATNRQLSRLRLVRPGEIERCPQCGGEV